MKLLHIDSSIQGDASASRLVGAAIVDRLKAADPALEVAYRDLAAAPLPHLTLPGFATEEAQAVLAAFLEADIVVIGAPMYNFSVPGQLKAWLDHVIVAGQTFSYGPEGVVGLAGGKRIIIAHSRGNFYSSGSPVAANEHAESYLRAVFGFIGVTDIEVITTEGVALGEEPRKTALQAALARVEHIADTAAAA